MKATFQNFAHGKIENENVATDQNFKTESGAKVLRTKLFIEKNYRKN